MEFLTSTIELRPIWSRISQCCHHEEKKRRNQHNLILHHERRHWTVVVDHESDLSSSKQPVLFVGFLLLEADLLLELKFWTILFRAEAICASKSIP